MTPADKENLADALRRPSVSRALDEILSGIFLDGEAVRESTQEQLAHAYIFACGQMSAINQLYSKAGASVKPTPQSSNKLKFESFKQ